MNKVEFGKIDKLRDPQRFVSAIFDNRYVTFVKSEKMVGELEVIATKECILGLLKWSDDKSAIKVYGFDCKTDELANIFNAYLADRWVVLDFVDKERVAHHEFLSIDSLRKLVRKMEEVK